MTHLKNLPDRTQHHAKILPLKARRVIADLERKGIGDLYTVNVDHLPACQISKGMECNCITNISLTEKVAGASTLTEKQQRQLAAFRTNGAPQFTAREIHASGCGVQRGAACSCDPDIAFESPLELAADTVASAINAMTAATIGQTNAIREQTAALVDVLGRDARKVEFSRDNKGQITSAKIKDV